MGSYRRWDADHRVAVACALRDLGCWDVAEPCHSTRRLRSAPPGALQQLPNELCASIVSFLDPPTCKAKWVSNFIGLSTPGPMLLPWACFDLHSSGPGWSAVHSAPLLTPRCLEHVARVVCTMPLHVDCGSGPSGMLNFGVCRSILACEYGYRVCAAESLNSDNSYLAAVSIGSQAAGAAVFCRDDLKRVPDAAVDALTARWRSTTAGGLAGTRVLCHLQVLLDLDHKTISFQVDGRPVAAPVHSPGLLRLSSSLVQRHSSSAALRAFVGISGDIHATVGELTCTKFS